MAVEEGQVADAVSSGAVSMNDQFDVYAEQPLKRLDSPPALAYACTAVSYTHLTLPTIYSV